MGPAPFNSYNMMVSELISLITLDWDREKIRDILTALEEEILEIKLSGFGAADSHAWLPAKTGLYTAKSGYYEDEKMKRSQTITNSKLPTETSIKQKKSGISRAPQRQNSSFGK